MKKYSKVSLFLAGVLTFSALGISSSMSTANAVTKNTVNVASKAKPVSISSIANINMTVKQNQSVSLPKTVTAIMSNKTKKAVPVKWDAKSVSTKKVGKVQIKGTVSGFKNKVVLNITINAIKQNTTNSEKPKQSTTTDELRVIDIH